MIYCRNGTALLQLLKMGLGLRCQMQDLITLVEFLGKFKQFENVLETRAWLQNVTGV